MHATRRLPIVIAVLCFGIIAPSAIGAAEVPCSQRVLNDWSDNGRIDRVYALPCYEDAIAELPTDIRDYTNAYDAIDRAMTRVFRGKTLVPTSEPGAVRPERAVAIDDSAALPVPIPLLVLFGLALALLAAGALGRIGRRATLGRRGTPR